MKMKTKKRNYMGMLVVNHYTADEAVDCIGAQLPSPSITEIALYEAAKDLETGKVIRGDLISKVHMSDHQFGNMIGRPNFNNGQLVTINSTKGFNVSCAKNEQDPAKKDLAKEIKHFLGQDDNQVARFINEMLVLSENALAKNRLSKQGKDDIRKYAGMLLTYVQLNEEHALNMINNVAEKRANEVKSSIHHTIRDAYRIGGEPLLLIADESSPKDKCPTIGAAGFMMVGVGGSTNIPLFDDVNMSSSVVDISLASASIKESAVSINGDEYRKDFDLFTITMSPEQYARFVRADKMEVSCTISSRFGINIDEFEQEDTREVLFAPLNSSDLYAEYIHAVKQIVKGLDSDSFKGKSGLASLVDGFNIVKQRYEEYLQDSTDAKLSAAQELFYAHQKSVSEYFQREVAVLPDSLKKEIIPPLSGLVSKVLLQVSFNENKAPDKKD
tara:strand:+ start:11111 stop:12439 length:1329 start_codon:yes stop_codon:yes gene_type:complete